MCLLYQVTFIYTQTQFKSILLLTFIIILSFG